MSPEVHSRTELLIAIGCENEQDAAAFLERLLVTGLLLYDFELSALIVFVI
jgi:hypothetical protein